MSGGQAPTPAWLDHNPGSHNKNVEPEPSEFLLIRGATAGSTELLFQIILAWRQYGQNRGKKFDHALLLIDSKHRRSLGRAPPPGQAVVRPQTDLPVVVCSMRCRRAGLWLANTPHMQ